MDIASGVELGQGCPHIPVPGEGLGVANHICDFLKGKTDFTHVAFKGTFPQVTLQC